MDIGYEYLKISKDRFNAIKKLGDQTISQLTEIDIHWKINEASNSVAVITKHLNGNMISRWSNFLTSDGEKSNRNRDQEFVDDINSKKELIIVWEKGWNTFFDTLNQLKPTDLCKSVTIRSEVHTVLAAIERQLAHYAYHIGQIVYIGKQLRNDEWESLSIPIGKSDEHLQG